MSSLLVFNRVHRLEFQSIMLVFSTQLCVLMPLTFSLVHKVKVHYLHTVCGLEGVVDVELCWRPYSAGG